MPLCDLRAGVEVVWDAVRCEKLSPPVRQTSLSGDWTAMRRLALRRRCVSLIIISISIRLLTASRAASSRDEFVATVREFVATVLIAFFSVMIGVVAVSEEAAAAAAAGCGLAVVVVVRRGDIIRLVVDIDCISDIDSSTCRVRTRAIALRRLCTCVW